MSLTQFRPENFTLDPNATTYLLDQEVAARIADVIYFVDTRTQKAVSYSSLSVVVDPTGQTLTSPNKYSGEIGQYESNRVSFSASLSKDVNSSFARHMQAVLLERERRSNVRLLTSLGYTSFVVGVPLMSLVGVTETVTDPIDSIFMASVTGMFAVSFWAHEARRYYRRNVLRAGSILNQRKLAVAEKIVQGLGLPPVVS